MRLLACVLVVTALSACSDGPQLGLGVNVGPNGVSVSPNLSGNVGGVNVGVTGAGVDL